MPRTSETSEAFCNDSLPAGDVADEYLENLYSPFAPSIEDRSRYVDSSTAAVEFMHQAGANQIANVRNRPVITDLNELVFPKPVDTSPGNCCLMGQNLHNAAEHIRSRGEPVF